MAALPSRVVRTLYRALLRQARQGGVSLVQPVDITRFGTHSYVAPSLAGHVSAQEALALRGITVPSSMQEEVAGLPAGHLPASTLQGLIRSGFRAPRPEGASVAAGMEALRAMSDLRQGSACSQVARSADVVVEVTTTYMGNDGPISLDSCAHSFCYRVRVHNTGASWVPTLRSSPRLHSPSRVCPLSFAQAPLWCSC